MSGIIESKDGSNIARLDLEDDLLSLRSATAIAFENSSACITECQKAILELQEETNALKSALGTNSTDIHAALTRIWHCEENITKQQNAIKELQTSCFKSKMHYNTRLDSTNRAIRRTNTKFKQLQIAFCILALISLYSVII